MKKGQKWDTKKMAERFAEIHKQRMDRFRRDTAEMHKAVLEQARTHALETHLLHEQIDPMKHDIRHLISLLIVNRRGEWTLACESEFRTLQERYDFT